MSDETTLARTLSFRDLTLLVVGAVIGSGIFLVPGVILRDVNGSVGLSLVVWLGGGVLSLLGALTYGELAAMQPEAGGLYVYIRDSFGRLPAFLYGWTLLLVIATGSVATLAVAFSAYLGEITPLSPLAAKAVAVIMIAAITAVNVRGARQSSDLQNWTTGVKVLAIAGMAGVLFVLGRHYDALSSALWPARGSGSVVSGFGVAMIAVLWAYEGWQFATYNAGEACDPQRDFPRAFLVGMLALIAIYMIAVLAYLVALSPAGSASSDTIAATAIAGVLGGPAAKLVASCILVSTFSGANSILLSAPRVFFAMSRDKLFFPQLAQVHPRFRTPAIAVVVCGVWSAVLACLGSFQQLFTYVIFAGWIFYGLAAGSIFVYRRKRPDAPRPYHVPGYPWTPAVFVAAAAALVLNTIIAGPSGAAEGLGILALGLPAYLFFRRPRSN